MPLSENQLKDVCRYGDNHHECRYLDGEHDPSGIKFVCKKLSLERKSIDEEVSEYELECKLKNINPASSGVPMGDNCKGYLPMKDLVQGYDV